MHINFKQGTHPSWRNVPKRARQKRVVARGHNAWSRFINSSVSMQIPAFCRVACASRATLRHNCQVFVLEVEMKATLIGDSTCLFIGRATHDNTAFGLRI